MNLLSLIPVIHATFGGANIVLRDSLGSLMDRMNYHKLLALVIVEKYDSILVASILWTQCPKFPAHLLQILSRQKASMLLQHSDVFYALTMRLRGQAPKKLSHRLSAANRFIKKSLPSHSDHLGGHYNSRVIRVKRVRGFIWFAGGQAAYHSRDSESQIRTLPNHRSEFREVYVRRQIRKLTAE